MVKKHVSVKLLGDAKESYLALQQKVKEERENGIESSVFQILLKSIESKIALLKINCDYGIQIPRKNTPQKYLQHYEVTNLWKVNLSGYWRMIYTLKQPYREKTGVDFITVWLDILDIIDHQTYDKIFGYKKR